jgi:hypothetical protein
MKPSNLSALLACAAFMAPWGAQAAMDGATRSTFTQECISAARQQNLNEQTAKAHCDCGAKQMDSHFSDKEIAELNNTSTSPSPAMTSKLKKLVAENCTHTKK